MLSHVNHVHCGLEYLSMSKNTMICVFDCANDCNVKNEYIYIYIYRLNSFKLC